MKQLALNRKFKSDFSDLKRDTCPNCGYNQLNRIKRKNIHRLLSISLLGTINLKRYACERCEWKGIKILE